MSIRHIEINGQDICSERDFHKLMAEKLDFGPYYGNNTAISIVKWAQSQFHAILPGGVIDSKPLMKAGSNKTTTKYEAMKEQLLQEAKTNQSK